MATMVKDDKLTEVLILYIWLYYKCYKTYSIMLLLSTLRTFPLGKVIFMLHTITACNMSNTVL